MRAASPSVIDIRGQWASATNLTNASLMAFQAGADILLICKERERQVAAMEAIYRAVKDGKISETRLDASLRRIARAKERFLTPSRKPSVHNRLNIPRRRNQSSDAREIRRCSTPFGRQTNGG